MIFIYDEIWKSKEVNNSKRIGRSYWCTICIPGRRQAGGICTLQLTIQMGRGEVGSSKWLPPGCQCLTHCGSFLRNMVMSRLLANDAGVLKGKALTVLCRCLSMLGTILVVVYIFNCLYNGTTNLRQTHKQLTSIDTVVGDIGDQYIYGDLSWKFWEIVELQRLGHIGGWTIIGSPNIYILIHLKYFITTVIDDRISTKELC